MLKYRAPVEKDEIALSPKKMKNGGCSELGYAECFSINFLLKKDEIAIAYNET